MRIFRVLFLIWFLLAAAAYSAGTVLAQSELSRISIAERSDGRGFVLRYHLSEAPDSFMVVRPSVNLVQVNLYGSRLAGGEVPLGENDEIEEVQLFGFENGVGADIYLNENVFFNTNAYPDINGTDLLLAFEYASEESVMASVTENREFSRERVENEVNSPPLQDTPEDVAETENIQEGDDGDIRVQPETVRPDEKKVTVGVAAGISMADVQGSAFASEIRQGTSFGLAVGVRLPWELPLNIATGIETGVYYAQKGFKNPSPDFLNAETVEFDYIEIPLLAKFRYPLIERVSPYILAGPSIGFNVNAERVRSDESRADLDDQTKSADISLVLGGGFDVNLNRQVLSIQARGGLSFSDVFETNAGSSPTDFFKHRYIALELIFRL